MTDANHISLDLDESQSSFELINIKFEKDPLCNIVTEELDIKPSEVADIQKEQRTSIMDRINKAELISYVRQHKFLYDPNEKMYNDSNLKEDAWWTIGRKLKQTPEVCRSQWNNLRDIYRRNIKRNKMRYEKTGEIPKRWKFDDEMEFILPFIKKRKARDRLPTFLEDDPLSRESEQEETISIEQAETSTQIYKNPTIKTKSNSQNKPSGSVITQNEAPSETTNIDTGTDSNAKRNTPELDELEMFFSSLAKTVKRFKPINRVLAKQKVLSIVSQIEIKDLQHPESTAFNLNDIDDNSVESSYFITLKPE